MNKIVLENFNKDDGYYKVNLAYLSKEQVEEIQSLLEEIHSLLSKWNPVDENIKSCIRMCLTDANEQRFKDYGTNLRDCLAWLEKQGELISEAYEKGFTEGKRIERKAKEPKWSEEEIKEAQLDYWRSVGGKEWHGVPVQETIAWLERQGEQVVILHKFKVGDWIVSKWGGIYQIKEVMSGSYNLLCTNNAEEINSITQVDNNSRLLCIGDIKNLESQGKQKWSDKDENFFANICTIIDADRNFTESAKRKCKDWLKSLKKRMEE